MLTLLWLLTSTGLGVLCGWLYATAAPPPSGQALAAAVAGAGAIIALTFAFLAEDWPHAPE